MNENQSMESLTGTKPGGEAHMLATDHLNAQLVDNYC